MRSTEDLTEDSEPSRRHSAAETITGLASALKAKLQKNNKVPPTPPKKDFLTEEDLDNSDERASPENTKPEPPRGEKPALSNGERVKSGMFPLPGVGRAGLKKPAADRRMQPPPPAPPGKSTADEKPPGLVLPAKPVKDLKPVPPALSGKPGTENKPVLPPSNNKPKPSALKPAFPVSENTHKPDTTTKPKPPIKAKPAEDEIEGKVNVADIAGALKAKFEQDKPGVTQKPTITSKPKPGLAKKPTSGSPNTPVKPGITQKPQMASKPSWVKDNTDGNENTKPESAPKVSDLASVLKAKFENRQPIADQANNDTKISQDSVPLRKPALKPAEKPPRPFSPPTPKKNLPANSPTRPVTMAVFGDRSGSPVTSRSKSPLAMNTRKLDPAKYSSRPLPPSPKDKQEDKPQAGSKLSPGLPSKPRKMSKPENTDSSDSDSSELPVGGVSSIANALKNKFGGVGTNNASKPPVNSTAKPKHVDNHVKKADIENNNAGKVNDGDTEYEAIADFAGFNEGEMKLEIGQKVELLDVADGWSYVSSGHSEGWVPSTYIEKAIPVSSRETVKSIHTSSPARKGNQSVFKIGLDFEAENEGELSVREGQEVTVLDQPEGGWWFVKCGHDEGWIPASYLVQS